MRITRWAEYGILCCVYLARKQEKDYHNAVGAADISKAQSIPLQYTQQILHRLRKGGIIRSVRGPHGGFMLAHPPQEINLKHILAATDGDTFEVICETDPVYPHLCNSAHDCGLRGVWHELKASIDKTLENYTLQRIMHYSSIDASIVQIGESAPQV